MSVGVAAVLAGILGAIIGSFLNVVAYRLPRGESLSHPPSRCPSCGTPIKPYDNVPVLWWLLLRGRCRDCGAPISRALPARRGRHRRCCARSCVLAKGADEDVWLGARVRAAARADHADRPRPPDHPEQADADRGGGRRSCSSLLTDPSALVEHLIAALGAGGFFLVAALAYPAGMGMGDVKLAVVMGLFLGRAVAPAMFVALVSGIAGRRRRSSPARAPEKGRKTAIPFGPYLAFGGLVGLFVGDAIVDWYLDILHLKARCGAGLARVG